nr:hypothetical protein [Tanacetum cinerariifolium]
EMVPTPFGSIHAYYDTEEHTKHFTSLHELLHMVEKNDLRKFLGDVEKSIKGTNLRHLESWRLYPRAHVYVLETMDRRVIYMFVDVSYPLSKATLEWMLRHGLEVPKLLVGGDDDDGYDEWTSRVSTPSPTRFVNSLTNDVPQASFPLFLSSLSSSNHPTMDSTQASSSNPSKKIKLTIIPPRQLFVNISSDEDVTTTPSPITTSSSPFLPNAPSKTPSTKDTSSTFGTTSSSFEPKPQSSPPTSSDTPSSQPSNHFLKNVMDAPPRPSHPLPLQSYPSLDITLSLSPITSLDHTLNTPSPPLP